MLPAHHLENRSIGDLFLNCPKSVANIGHPVVRQQQGLTVLQNFRQRTARGQGPGQNPWAGYRDDCQSIALRTVPVIHFFDKEGGGLAFPALPPLDLRTASARFQLYNRAGLRFMGRHLAL